MQSYTGDTGEPFTNIYHATLKDGVHLGEELPLVIGRAEGENNKANARLIAAAPDLLEALRQWKCPSCGGSGIYKQQWSQKQQAGSETTCKVCHGGGLNPIASAAIAKAEAIDG